MTLRREDLAFFAALYLLNTAATYAYLWVRG